MLTKIFDKFGEDVFDDLDQVSMSNFYENVTKEEFLILEMNRSDQRYPEIAQSILNSLSEEEKEQKADLKWLVKLAKKGSFTLYGHCIKTNESIPLNPFRPVAYSVYKVSKTDPKGCYCHYCGGLTPVYVDDPFCEEHEYVCNFFKKK